MKRRSDLGLSFLLAVALHAGAGLALTALRPARQGLDPLFDGGLSSVELTLVAPAPARAALPPRRAEAEELRPPEARPVVQPVVVPERTESALASAAPEPSKSEAPRDQPEAVAAPSPVVDVTETPAPETEVPPAPVRDADALDKGVASRFILEGTVRPRYPVGSRYRGEEGTVVVQVVVGSDGRAIAAEVSETSGYGALDRAAVAAAGQARFSTAGASSPRDRTVTLTFRFELTAGGAEAGGF